MRRATGKIRPISNINEETNELKAGQQVTLLSRPISKNRPIGNIIEETSQ